MSMDSLLGDPPASQSVFPIHSRQFIPASCREWNGNDSGSKHNLDIDVIINLERYGNMWPSMGKPSQSRQAKFGEKGEK
jgi:hypothetical protein